MRTDSLHQSRCALSAVNTLECGGGGTGRDHLFIETGHLIFLCLISCLLLAGCFTRGGIFVRIENRPIEVK